jgi:hypothetical protein
MELSDGDRESLQHSPRSSSPDPVDSESMPPLPAHGSFVRRHIGPGPEDVARMVEVLGFADLDSFIDQVVPPVIRSSRHLRSAKAEVSMRFCRTLAISLRRTRATAPSSAWVTTTA